LLPRLPRLVAADATQMESRTAGIVSEDSVRVSVPPAGVAQLPCKEQAGNREPSSAPIFYTHRLVLGFARHTCTSSPALMLRSRAARDRCAYRAQARMRCAASRSMRAHRLVLILILRDARTHVRLGGTISHARSSG